MSDYSTIDLKMTRNFDVPAEKVFEAWMKPKMMKKWFFTLEGTNKVAQNNPEIGGTWEIIDVRDGKEYRAVGKYLDMDTPNRLVFTFEMPQFSETVDTITVVINELREGCEMIFTQHIIVPHEENWAASDIDKALAEYHEGTEHGWNLMFMGLKELVETGKVSYQG